MRQSEDLRFGGVLLEAVLADLRADLWGGSFCPPEAAHRYAEAVRRRSRPDTRLTRVARWRDPPGVVADSRETMEVPEEFA